jgi:hypothetical protein
VGSRRIYLPLILRERAWAGCENLIVNGDFEEEALTPWRVFGPGERVAADGTGQWAVRLAPELSELNQYVQVPAGANATLQFRWKSYPLLGHEPSSLMIGLQYEFSSTPGDEVTLLMRVAEDSQGEWREESVSYDQRQYDDVVVTFTVTGEDPDSSDFWIDDVRLVVCTP